jgi:hypothetical protein
MLRPFLKALETPINVVVDEMDVIGSKSIVERNGYTMQNSGECYNSK